MAQPESKVISDQIVGGQVYQTTPSSGGGPDFNVAEGVGIAAAFIPLVSLFKGGGGHKSKSKARPVVRRQVQQISMPTSGSSGKSNLLLIGGGAILVLGIGYFAMTRGKK